MAYVSPTWNTTNTYIKYRVVTDLISQDINANTSYVRVRLEAWRTNNYTTYGTGTGCVRVNGGEYCDAITSSQQITLNSYTILSDEYVVVGHNSDGTKNLTCGGYFTINAPVSGGWNEYSFDLPTIPRASSVTATNSDIEAATTIVINRYSTSFTHTLNYTFGTLSGTIVSGTSDTTIGWTVPSSFYAEIPNSATGTCTITCLTYNGGTQIGSSTTTFIASVNSSNSPEVSATIVDSDALTTSLTGDSSKFVKYFSDAAFSITSTPKNSATIVSRSIVCNGKSSTSSTGTLTDVESGTFVVSTTDSRGFSSSVTYTKTLVDYVKLTVNPTFSRNTPVDGLINLTYNGNYFNSTFGSVANTLSLKYRYRIVGGSWSAYVTTLVPVITDNTYAQTLQLSGTFMYTNAYEFEIVATDQIYSSGVSVASVVPSGVPIMAWNKNRVTINGDLSITGSIVGSGTAVPAGQITPWVTNTAPTGWMICDGSAISRTTYAALFTTIGTTYGSGDGSTTFNIPNLKGRVIVGRDASQTEFDVLGETGGSKWLQAHGHEVRVNSFAGDLGIAISQGGGDGSWYGVQDYPEANYHWANPYGTASSFYAAGTGYGNSQNLQPYMVVNYIIKLEDSIMFKGEKGEKGDDGADGPKGDTGTGGVLGYYGSFFDTTDQYITTPNTPQVVGINSTGEASGISLGGNGKYVIEHAGTYSMTFSIQLRNTDNVTHYADIWLKYNGEVYPDSNTRFHIPARKSAEVSGYAVATVNFVGTAQNDNDYVELWWLTDDGSMVTMETIPASNGVPETPSVICTFAQVMYTQEGPQGPQGDDGPQGPAGGDTQPVGTIVPYAGSTTPTNWLLCDGSAVSRTTYAQLFSAIGVRYGSGDGSTTFNLPNLKGRVPVGQDTSQTEFDVLGETGGAKTHTLTVAEMPSHTHRTGIQPDRAGNYNDGGSSAYVYFDQTSGKETTTTGGSQAHNNLQPYQVVNYIIKHSVSSTTTAVIVDNLTSTSSVDALSANMGNLLKTNLNGCFLPVEWGWFKLTSLSNLADGATRTTLPITKVAGSFTVSSNYITLTKGYLYEVNMDFAYDNNGASGIAYITLLNVSTSADLMWRQNEKLSNAMTSSPESGCVGFGIIDLTSAPSDIQAKCHVPLSTNTGSLSPSIGGLYITKYKKVVL